MLGIALATMAAYSAVFSFDFVNYDDPVYVYENRALEPGVTLKTLRWAFEANLTFGSREAEYWQPVTSISRLVDQSLFGRNPTGHHVQSLLWHVLNSCLVFLLARALGASAAFAGAFGLIFALHPLNAEVVSWLAARKDLLCGFGSLLTLLAYVHFAQRRSLGRYLLALAAYMVALMAKPSAIALPLALLLLDVWPLCRMKNSSSGGWKAGVRQAGVLLAEKIPFGLLAVLVAGLTFVSQREVGGVKSPDSPLLVRLGDAAIGYVDYLRLFFWPRNLCVLYFADASSDTLVGLSAASVLLAITLLSFALRKRVPGISVGWLWFIGLLSPLMGLVPFGRQSVADRYMYIPQLGLITIAMLVAAVFLGLMKPAQRKAIGATALFVVCLCLGWVTHAQSLTWTDSFTLWTQALQVDQGSGVAHVNFAQPLDRAGRIREAEFQLRLARKCRPESLEFQQSLVLFLVVHRRYAEVVPLAEKLIQADAMNMKVHAALVTSLRLTGREEEALRALARQEAIRGRVFLMMGTSYLQDQEWNSAVEQFRSAWTAADGVEIGMHRRIELASAADWRPHAEQALGGSLGPVSDQRNLLRGLVFALQNRWPEAEAAFAVVVHENPNDAEARWRRAVSLRRLGRLKEAEDEFAEAQKLAPNDAARDKAWTAAGGKSASTAAPP